ncbi:hypothetical protein V1506DRAFT_548370 [Lipomyces tetrasporus]
MFLDVIVLILVIINVLFTMSRVTIHIPLTPQLPTIIANSYFPISKSSELTLKPRLPSLQKTVRYTCFLRTESPSTF